MSEREGGYLEVLPAEQFDRRYFWEGKFRNKVAACTSVSSSFFLAAKEQISIPVYSDILREQHVNCDLDDEVYRQVFGSETIDSGNRNWVKSNRVHGTYWAFMEAA